MNYNVGDKVNFGIHVTKEGAPSPIEWFVCKIEPNALKLISVSPLFERRYDEERWKDSELRTWLNGEVYESLFSDQEKLCILETVTNDDIAVRIDSEWFDDCVKDYYAGIVPTRAVLSRDLVTIPDFKDLFEYNNGYTQDKNRTITGREAYMLLNSLADYRGLFKMKHPRIKWGGFETYPSGAGVRLCIWVKSDLFSNQNLGE